MNHYTDEEVIKELENTLSSIVLLLVDNVCNVHIDSGIAVNSAVLEVRVDKEDRGKVIGKHGATADAIRRILNAGAAKMGLRSAILEIIED